jgi:hypothetical protein
VSSALRRAEEGYTYAGSSDLIVLGCPLCGVTYAIPVVMHRNAKRRGGWAIMWHCPNGHELGFGEGELDRERAARERAEAAILQARERAQAEKDLREHTEHKLRAQKGATTRARKRAAAALCPCCNRSFVQLRRHLATQHPDYRVDDAT